MQSVFIILIVTRYTSLGGDYGVMFMWERTLKGTHATGTSEEIAVPTTFFQGVLEKPIHSSLPPPTRLPLCSYKTKANVCPLYYSISLYV